MGDLRLIREGLCPERHGPLVRRDDYGWCEVCEAGFSIAGDFFTVFVEVGPRLVEDCGE